MFCREQVVRIGSIKDELCASGGRLIAIGNGTPEMARKFVDELKIDYPVFSDPDRKTYDALGLQTKLGIGLRTPGYFVRALKKGFFQGRTQGSALQQGGEALISNQGEVVWTRVSHEAGSHATSDEIRAAIKILAQLD